MVEFRHLPVVPMRITSPYGKRNTGIKGASKFHKGVDLGRDFSKSETTIHSVADGKVVKNYWNDYRGWVVVVEHNGFATLYQHLKEKTTLQVGKTVKSGDVVGIMGDSSNKSKLNIAMHLHFELHINGQPVDPMPYLEGVREMKKHWVEPSLNSLVEKGMIKNPEAHKDLDAPVTKGLLFTLLDRLTEKK